jgi:hypothetical protein
MSRRAFLSALAAGLAAPAIVRAESLMRVVPYVPPPLKLYPMEIGTIERFQFIITPISHIYREPHATQAILGREDPRTPADQRVQAGRSPAVGWVGWRDWEAQHHASGAQGQRAAGAATFDWSTAVAYRG